MRSDTVGKQDNWARFMQLSNEARLRNQGFGSGVRKAATSPRKAVPTRSVQQAPSITGDRGIQRAEILYNTAKPFSSGRGRILGGTFDAYA